MDDEMVKHLWALQKVNEALIEGLKTAIFVLERIEELTPERTESMVESLKGLVSQSEIIFWAHSHGKQIIGYLNG